VTVGGSMDLLEERRADRYRRSRRQPAARRFARRPPGQWRPGGAWTLAAVLAAGLLVGGVAGWSLAAVGARDRPAVATADGGQACRSVLAKADDSLALAVRFEHALTSHVRVMERLAQRAITPAQAVAIDRQPLSVGSADAARFDVALADYLASVDECRGR
jgi:hypothetical protein